MPSKGFQARSQERYQQILVKILEEGKYSSTQMGQIGRLLSEGVSNPEWKEVAQLSGLPKHRRFEINQAIEIYWQSKIEERRDTKTKARVSETRAYLKKLTALVEEVSLNPDFYNGVFPIHDASPMEQRLSLERGRAAIGELDRTLAKAEIRLNRTSGRPTFGPIFSLIRFLDVVLASDPAKFALTLAKKNPDKSSNLKVRCLIKIVMMAEPKVKQATVETILKQYISVRAKWGTDIILQTA